MPIEDIYAIRNRSMAWKRKQSGPWATDEKEMIRKTVVKQASKYWPKVERMQEAVRHLNEEMGEGIDFEQERQERAIASPEYQWGQLLIGLMSNGDGEALLDEWLAKDSEFQERAWKHLGSADRRQIKALLADERAERAAEDNQGE